MIDTNKTYITECGHHVRIEELEDKLAKAIKGLEESQEEIDQYIRQEYPSDHALHERYRQRDFAGNPARLAIAELKGETE